MTIENGSAAAQVAKTSGGGVQARTKHTQRSDSRLTRIAHAAQDSAAPTGGVRILGWCPKRIPTTPRLVTQVERGHREFHRLYGRYPRSVLFVLDRDLKAVAHLMFDPGFVDTGDVVDVSGNGWSFVVAPNGAALRRAAQRRWQNSIKARTGAGVAR